MLKSLKNKLSLEQAVVLPLLVFFFIVFTTISLNRYWQYATWYYDFGIFYQAISSVAQGKEPIIDHFIFTDQNILGDHFHPLIFLISPFVALFKTGEVLLVIQTLFVTLSGWFIYLTAKEILKNKFEAVSILIIYLSFIGLHNALITEFHALALLPLPLSMFFYGMVKKHKWAYFIGLLGVLITKETTFIIPAWFGLLVVIKNKGLWRKLGLFTMITSTVYGLAIIYLVIPAINGSEYYYLADAISDSNILPVMTSLKLQTVFRTFLSFGFLPIFAPETLPPVLFNWFSRFSSSGSTRHDLGMHYNAEIAPTLILATTYGWLRFKKVIKKVAFGKFEILRLKGNFGISFKKLLGLGLLSLSMFLFFLSTQVFKSPALLFTNKAFYKHTQNFEFLDRLVEAVPDDGVVMAQTNLAAKLADRKVYMLRDNYKDFTPDYIVLDTRDGQEPNNFLGIEDFEGLVASISADSDYELFYDQGEQMIYTLRSTSSLKGKSSD